MAEPKGTVAKEVHCESVGFALYENVTGAQPHDQMISVTTAGASRPMMT